jgi:hypothetical protein
MVLLLRAAVLRLASAASCAVSLPCTLAHQRGVKWPSNADDSEVTPTSRITSEFHATLQACWMYQEYRKYLQRRVRAQKRQDLRGVIGEGTSTRRPWNAAPHGSQKRHWGRPAAGKAGRDSSAGKKSVRASAWLHAILAVSCLLRPFGRCMLAYPVLCCAARI